MRTHTHTTHTHCSNAMDFQNPGFPNSSLKLIEDFLVILSLAEENSAEVRSSPCCHSVNWLQSPFSLRFSSSGRKRPWALSITVRPSSRINFQFLSNVWREDSAFTGLNTCQLEHHSNLLACWFHTVMNILFLSKLLILVFSGASYREYKNTQHFILIFWIKSSINVLVSPRNTRE